MNLTLALSADETRTVEAAPGVSVTVSALSPSEQAAATRRAGGMPLFGGRKLAELHEGEVEIDRALHRLATEDPEAHDAIFAYKEWTRAVALEQAAASLRGCSAWPGWEPKSPAEAKARLESILDNDSRQELIGFIAVESRKFGLGDEGKAPSAPPSGTHTATPDPAGPAKTAAERS